jgi:hypothetical protein
VCVARIHGIGGMVLERGKGKNYESQLREMRADAKNWAEVYALTQRAWEEGYCVYCRLEGEIYCRLGGWIGALSFLSDGSFGYSYLSPME